MSSTRHRYFPNESSETDPLYDSTQDSEEEEEVKAWNTFKNTPREPSVGSSVESKYYNLSVKLLKIVTYLVVFAVVLGTAVISKATTLFMTSQIKKDTTRSYCNKNLDRTVKFLVTIPEVERVTWIWLLIFAYLIPEAGTFIRSARKCLFKKWEFPSVYDFITLLITETCSAVGSAILIFLVLPELDVVKGAMLTNAVCFIPGVVGFFSRKPNSPDGSLKMILDIVSIVAQASSFVIWPLLEEKPILYAIPLSVILISIGWWENFVSIDSSIEFIRNIAESKKEFKNKTYFLYILLSVVKSIVFIFITFAVFWWREGDGTFIFDKFYDAFQNHKIFVAEIDPIISSATSPNYDDAIKNGNGTYIHTAYMTSIWVWIINILATYMCYAFGKFACKIMIQTFSFALPINLTVPVLISGLIGMCGSYSKDECSYSDFIPKYLFFNPPPLYFLSDFLSQQHSWIWLIWLLSQAWITVSIWSANCEKLSPTEKLFLKPMYDAFLIDQSLAMNRRKDEYNDTTQNVPENEHKEITEEDLDNDTITRIFACGTMWHETKEEILEFLKSIFRLDADQSAHRLTRNYLRFNLKSYYEFETHVFFDDAFVRTHKEDQDPHVNEYVELLVSLMDEAATKVHGTQVRVRPPIIYPTPYGGRLVWTLPGKTKMIAHLKDKAKIRAKKRWSQVMYMYYILGYRIMENDAIPPTSKNTVAENTYILALDGDIDFQPGALHLLVDFMKKNKTLGAACGRIHPIGSGAMVWYQMFEYAIGHWLQKATEHVIGCVLCSPGCFSLFRGSALADDGVMRKYATRSSQATHYVQYDQGEDRWLCTLLLQKGYRVEYSAASDAYTHCPEGFNEFYNQRRRWMPSTMANILDLLMDYKHTVAINENISTLYIGYQIVLMIGTVLGPGTIFLMLIGAFNTAFRLDQWTSLFWNLAPILLFVIICATCSSDIQLFFAGVISAVYGLIMMAVFVGVMLQISQDGFLAPSSLFFFCVAGEMIFAAMLHPKEFNCLKYGVVYYVTVPSMYMLLVIYSVFNMNNVSWGTRDVTVVPKVDPNSSQEANNQGKQPDKKNKVMSFLGATEADDAGSIEFSLNKLFKCMFCTYKGDVKEDIQLKRIHDSLEILTKKLERLERAQFNEETNEPNQTVTNMPPSILKNSNVRFGPDTNPQTEQKNLQTEPADDIIENNWFYDGSLIHGEVKFLERKEETFWKELLDKYLHPIEDDKEKVKKELKDLRDMMVFSFFMLNSLFVLVVFLLTLEKNNLHVNWPVEPKINFTYLTAKNEIHLSRTYLQLEPIGFVFLIFFALLMVIQGIAMIIHRFATYSQIMTNTRLNFGFFKQDINNMTEEEAKNVDPLEVAKELQGLKGINDETENLPEQPVENRKSINHLLQAVGRKSTAIFDLEKAFEMRLNQEAPDAHRKSVNFVKARRKTIEKRMSRLPPIDSGVILSNSDKNNEDDADA